MKNIPFFSNFYLLKVLTGALPLLLLLSPDDGLVLLEGLLSKVLTGAGCVLLLLLFELLLYSLLLDDELEDLSFVEGVKTRLITFPTPVCLVWVWGWENVLTGAALEFRLVPGLITRPLLLTLLLLPVLLYAPRFTFLGVELVTLPIPG